jgi:hypothetical protein
MQEDLYCHRLALHHSSGDILHPVRIRNSATGKLAFVLSRDGNRRDAAIEVDDEQELIRLATQKGYAVRCSNLERSRQGLYSINGRSILRHEIKSI